MSKRIIINGVEFKDGYRTPVLANAMWLCYAFVIIINGIEGNGWVFVLLGVLNAVFASLSLYNQIRFYRASGL